MVFTFFFHSTCCNTTLPLRMLYTNKQNGQIFFRKYQYVKNSCQNSGGDGFQFYSTTEVKMSSTICKNTSLDLKKMPTLMRMNSGQKY